MTRGIIVAINPPDLWGMILYSVRYALGRQTYAADDAIGYVLRYAAALKTRDLAHVVSEIDQWCTWNGKHPLVDEWLAGAKSIRAIIEERRKGGDERG
jgi:hypothetical protein